MHSLGLGRQIRPGLIVVGSFQHHTGSTPQPCVQAKSSFVFVYDSVGLISGQKGFEDCVKDHSCCIGRFRHLIEKLN